MSCDWQCSVALLRVVVKVGLQCVIAVSPDHTQTRLSLHFLAMRYVPRSNVSVHLFFALLNSVQKFCCNGFSKFLLLYVILGNTSLWESYWCRPPLMSPVSPVHVRAPCIALISWEKSWNWETHPQTKTIWHQWNALHKQIWKHQ